MMPSSRRLRALVRALLLGFVVMSATGCGSLCWDLTRSPVSGSGACTRHDGVLISLGSLLRWSLLAGVGVYLWRRGSGFWARLRGAAQRTSFRPWAQPFRAPRADRLRILFLAANPTSSAKLDLTREARRIEALIDPDRRPSNLELITHWAVRRSDLQRLLLDVKPHVLHFSGHGSTRSQILLEDDDGNAVPVEKEALVNLIGIIPGNLRLVVLNACDTEPIAEALVQHVACAIGMREPIGNAAAIAFAAAFYQALAFGQPIATAFRLGCNELEILRIPEEGTPSLSVAPDIDAETFVITAP